jgi:hypothetical protein
MLHKLKIAHGWRKYPESFLTGISVNNVCATIATDIVASSEINFELMPDLSDQRPTPRDIRRTQLGYGGQILQQFHSGKGRVVADRAISAQLFEGNYFTRLGIAMTAGNAVGNKMCHACEVVCKDVVAFR